MWTCLACQLSIYPPPLVIQEVLLSYDPCALVKKSWFTLGGGKTTTSYKCRRVTFWKMITFNMEFSDSSVFALFWQQYRSLFISSTHCLHNTFLPIYWPFCITILHCVSRGTGMSRCSFGGQSTACRNWSSTMWVSGVEFRLSGLVAGAFTRWAIPPTRTIPVCSVWEHCGHYEHHRHLAFVPESDWLKCLLFSSADRCSFIFDDRNYFQ